MSIGAVKLIDFNLNGTAGDRDYLIRSKSNYLLTKATSNLINCLQN